MAKSVAIVSMMDRPLLVSAISTVQRVCAKQSFDSFLCTFVIHLWSNTQIHIHVLLHYLLFADESSVKVLFVFQSDCVIISS